jgi:hypothetical protein
VPPAWKKVAKLEESVTDVPTVIVVADKEVVIVGLALLTVRGSQALGTGLLFASPPYTASQLDCPADDVVNGAEFGTVLPLPMTSPDSVNIGVPEQDPTAK